MNEDRYIGWVDLLEIKRDKPVWTNVMPANNWCFCDNEYHVAQSIGSRLLESYYPQLVKNADQLQIYVFDKDAKVAYLFGLKLHELDPKLHNARYRVEVKAKPLVKSSETLNNNTALMWRVSRLGSKFVPTMLSLADAFNAGHTIWNRNRYKAYVDYLKTHKNLVDEDENILETPSRRASRERASTTRAEPEEEEEEEEEEEQEEEEEEEEEEPTSASSRRYTPPAPEAQKPVSTRSSSGTSSRRI